MSEMASTATSTRTPTSSSTLPTSTSSTVPSPSITSSPSKCEEECSFMKSFAAAAVPNSNACDMPQLVSGAVDCNSCNPSNPSLQSAISLCNWDAATLTSSTNTIASSATSANPYSYLPPAKTDLTRRPATDAAATEQPSKSGLSTQNKWIIGTTAALLPTLITLVVCYIIYRRRRRGGTTKLSEKVAQLGAANGDGHYPDDYDTPRPKARPLTWPNPPPAAPPYSSFQQRPADQDLEKAIAHTTLYGDYNNNNNQIYRHAAETRLSYQQQQQPQPHLNPSSQSIKSSFTNHNVDKRLPSPEDDVYVVHMVFEDPVNGRSSVVSCEGHGKERQMHSGFSHGRGNDTLQVPGPVYNPMAPVPPVGSGAEGPVAFPVPPSVGPFRPGHKKGRPSLTLQTKNLGMPAYRMQPRR